MTPAAKPRVSDERLEKRIAQHEARRWASAGIDQDIALDLRDERAEAAQWRECAGQLANALRALRHGSSWLSRAKANDALARFDAMDKEGVFAGVRAEVQRKYDAAVSHVPVADANAAILRLQKRLDAVRPVVAAAEALRRYHKGEPPEFFVKLRARLAAYDAAVLALPAADREWVTKGE